MPWVRVLLMDLFNSSISRSISSRLNPKLRSLPVEGIRALCETRGQSVLFDLIQIPVVVAPHLFETIPAELIQRGRGKNNSDHCFSNNARSRDGNNIRALEGSGRFLFRNHIDAGKRPPQSGNRLKVAARPQELAVGNTAFEPARPVCGAHKPAFVNIIAYFVVNLRSGEASCLYAIPDFDGFDSGDRHNRLSQTAIKLLVPVNVRAEPYDNACGNDLEDSAESVF